MQFKRLHLSLAIPFVACLFQATPSLARGNPISTQQPAGSTIASATLVVPGRPFLPKHTNRANDEFLSRQVLKRMPPVYPPEAEKAGAQGQVVVCLFVLADGRVGRVVLLRSSGNAYLDRAAIDAVKAWRFAPSKRSEVSGDVTINFRVK